MAGAFEPCGGRPGPTLEPCDSNRPASSRPPEVKEFRADFATPAHTLDGVSLDRRPDAISPDYLTSRTPGPEAVGDGSKGLAHRAWQIDARTPGVVRLQRGEGEDWGEGEVLFTYTGPAIREVDVAFDQNANVVVSAERRIGGASEVWLYYFDSLTSLFVWEKVANGRTPRVVLDDPGRVITGESDVLLVYLSDANGRLEYRQQRDRFGEAHPGPLSDVRDLYLEEVARTTDLRVRFLLSVHDPVSGTYEPLEIDTLRFPFTVTEPWTMPPAQMLKGQIQEIGPPECWTISHPELTGGRLAELVLTYEVVEPWTLQHATLTEGVLKSLVQSYTLPAPEAYTIQHPSLAAGLLKAVVAGYTLHDSEPWTLQHAQLLGGTLVKV